MKKTEKTLKIPKDTIREFLKNFGKTTMHNPKKFWVKSVEISEKLENT